MPQHYTKQVAEVLAGSRLQAPPGPRAQPAVHIPQRTGGPRVDVQLDLSGREEQGMARAKAIRAGLQALPTQMRSMVLQDENVQKSLKPIYASYPFMMTNDAFATTGEEALRGKFDFVYPMESPEQRHGRAEAEVGVDALDTTMYARKGETDIEYKQKQIEYMDWQMQQAKDKALKAGEDPQMAQVWDLWHKEVKELNDERDAQARVGLVDDVSYATKYNMNTQKMINASPSPMTSPMAIMAVTGSLRQTYNSLVKNRDKLEIGSPELDALYQSAAQLYNQTYAIFEDPKAMQVLPTEVRAAIEARFDPYVMIDMDMIDYLINSPKWEPAVRDAAWARLGQMMPGGVGAPPRPRGLLERIPLIGGFFEPERVPVTP